MIPDLEAFPALDRHLALELGALLGEARPELLVLTAVVSRATRDGHACVSLDDLRFVRGAELLPAAWCDDADQLPASPLIGGPEADTPLVRDRRRLYLRRHYAHEAALAQALRARATTVTPVDEAQLGALVAGLFPPSPLDWQRVGVALSAGRKLAVLTGGPGTGKTTTVIRLVVAHVQLALAAGQPMPQVRLLAPTGKAAARLTDAMRGRRSSLPEAWRVGVPDEASTLHRALGAGPRGWRHGPHQPLPADLVVVDEASMVDLAMMRRLVDALLPDAALVLLGDRDQLASVESGSVLADVCGTSRGAPYRPETAARLRALSGDVVPAGPAPALREAIVELEVSHRFDATSPIGRLAVAIRDGDVEGAVRAAAARPAPAEGRLSPSLRDAVIEGYRPLFEAQRPAEALAALDRFRLLCAHRRGPFGVLRVAELVEAALREAGLVRGERDTYPGRPVLVTENDYGVDLFNGDTGVFFPDADGRPKVWFAGDGDALRSFAPSRLPAHESAYAMSVHKSQGSEFDDVALLLPDASSRLLTRELLYTAVTRAKHTVRVWGAEDALRRAVATRAVRASGLGDRLWRDAP